MADKMTRQQGSPTPVPVPGTHNPLASLRDEMDRLFDSFFPLAFGRSALDPASWGRQAFRTLGGMTPQMDAKECANHYEISAELPGMEEKDVTVKVQGGILSISGEKREERKEEGESLHLSERSFGSFTRSMRLPENADEEGIRAEYAKGVLTVTIPKRAGSESGEKTIEIKAH